jgi:hypothetical protein
MNSNTMRGLPYGEVEDYTVNITAGAAADTTAPSAPSTHPLLERYHNYKFIMERFYG